MKRIEHGGGAELRRGLAVGGESRAERRHGERLSEPILNRGGGRTAGLSQSTTIDLKS